VVAALVVTGTGPSAVPAGTLALAVTKRGYGFRFNLDPLRELSTRAGRRFAKPAEGDEVVGVLPVRPKDVLCVVSARARALLCQADEAAELANPGRGVTIIKLDEEDAVVGFALGTRKDDTVLIVETDAGKKIPVGPGRYHVTARGGRGHSLARKASVVRVLFPEPPAPADEPKLLH
jgi:DNA gyrase subunit A